MSQDDHLVALRQRARAALRDFVEGAASGDLDRLYSSLEALSWGEHDGGGWRRALLAVARLRRVPRATREGFLSIFLSHGDRIRQDTDDDLILVDGLRVLLPPYRGPSMLLYRGDSALNRRFRRYGASWTSSRDVARDFAEVGVVRCHTGGTVLLAARVNRSAIVCAPAHLDDRYDEQEFIVDRRRLNAVAVEARFNQLTPDELLALQRERASDRGQGP